MNEEKPTIMTVPLADKCCHPVQFKWVVCKKNGGNYGLTYPIQENKGKS